MYNYIYILYQVLPKMFDFSAFWNTSLVSSSQPDPTRQVLACLYSWQQLLPCVFVMEENYSIL